MTSNTKKLRLYAGKTQTQMCEEIGITKPTLIRIERCQPVAISTVSKWAEYFDLSIEEAMELGAVIRGEA